MHNAQPTEGLQLGCGGEDWDQSEVWEAGRVKCSGLRQPLMSGGFALMEQLSIMSEERCVSRYVSMFSTGRQMCVGRCACVGLQGPLPVLSPAVL